MKFLVSLNALSATKPSLFPPISRIKDCVYTTKKGLALTYFRGELPHNYRLRCGVSLLCSEWEEVLPPRPKDQTFFGNYKNCLINNLYFLIWIYSFKSEE